MFQFTICRDLIGRIFYTNSGRALAACDDNFDSKTGGQRWFSCIYLLLCGLVRTLIYKAECGSPLCVASIWLDISSLFLGLWSGARYQPRGGHWQCAAFGQVMAENFKVLLFLRQVANNARNCQLFRDLLLQAVPYYSAPVGGLFNQKTYFKNRSSKIQHTFETKLYDQDNRGSRWYTIVFRIIGLYAIYWLSMLIGLSTQLRYFTLQGCILGYSLPAYAEGLLLVANCAFT